MAYRQVAGSVAGVFYPHYNHLYSVAALTDASGADDFGIDLVWHRYRFSQTGQDGRPALYRSVSRSGWTVSARATSPGLYEAPIWLRTIRTVTDPYDASQTVPAWTNEDVEVGTASAEAGSSVELAPSVRRDRRRSMLDNDTRLMPNIPGPVYRCWTTDSTGTRVPCSDDELLDADYALVTDDISRFQVELVDLRGSRTIAGCDASGIPQALVYQDKAGSVLAPPPTPAAPFPDVWSSSLRVLDGLWSDGRSTPCPFPGAVVPAPALERPVLIRISFRLSDRDSGRFRDFSFSLPTTSLSVAE